MKAIEVVFNFVRAIYNFIVGDMVILTGMIIAVLILALLNSVSALASLRVVSGVILVLAVLIILLATLVRETSSKH
ncbi:MAG TPA: hypothetical protein VKV19_13625 [Ktedonobacteraceae bacterium]|jgi:hypothetical protein|nr:hypothetical protein [Ktedonobacteraceae bacterium]